MTMTNRQITLWFSMICLAAVTAASGQAIARLDSARLETGNPMTLHLQVTGGQPQGVDFSAWDSLVPLENRLTNTDWRAENGHWVREMTFVVFDSARLELPPIGVRLQSGAALQTNPLTLEVYPTPIAGNQPADIKDIRREQAIWLDYWPIFAGIGLILLIFLVWLWRRKSPAPAPESRAVELALDELTFRKLAALREKALWKSGQLKAHYSELTFIAREYLEKRYGIPALESTSDETLRLLARTDFPADFAQPLRDILQWADLAKFAKSSPPDALHEAAIGSVRAMVEATTPLPQRGGDGTQI